jgi:glucokinase
MPYYAGVDLGATKVRAAVADGEGSVVATQKRSTPRGPAGIAVTEAVLDCLRDTCERAGVEPSALSAAGIGSIGPLDLAAGVVDNPANLPAAVDRIPLVGPVRELIASGQVYLHNDTTAGVIGERFHSDRNPDDMVYLTISSGIGAGVCVDGEVLDGWDGNAGEVGHMVVDPDGEMTCGCGREGHWEAYCSGNNIPRYARRIAETEGVETNLDLEDLDAATVFARTGKDPLATRTVERVGEWNAVGVTNLAQAYAPLVVYVGGAVALSNESVVLDPIRDRLERCVFNNVPDVQLTNLGEDVVLRGAIASALTGGTGDRGRLG